MLTQEWEQLLIEAAAQVEEWEAEYIREEDPEGQKGIEPFVRHLVISLTALGYKPTGSCEGHEYAPGRMSDTYVVVFARRDQQDAWLDLCRALLLEPPMPRGAAISISRGPNVGNPEVFRWLLSIRYPQERENVALIRADATRYLAKWFTFWATRQTERRQSYGAAQVDAGTRNGKGSA